MPLRTATILLSRTRILQLALPIMVANITVPLVGLVDTIIMGRMPDASHLAATAIGATIFSTIFWLFGFLRMGTGGLVAQALGRQTVRSDEDAPRTIFYRAVLVALICAVALLMVQRPLFNLCMLAFGTDPAVHTLAADYYQIRIWSAPATLVLYAISGALIGLQRMKAMLFNQLILNGVNIILNLTFFHWLGWGIKGVALASLLSDYVAVVTGLLLLKSGIPMRLAILKHPQVLDRKQLLAVVKINMDLLIRTLCLSLAFYWLTAAGAHLGTVVLAANAVLLQLIHMMSHGLDGFSHAVETLAGYAYGKRDPQLFRNSIRYGTEWGILMAAGISVFYLCHGAELVALITTQPQTREAAGPYLLWVALTPLISLWSFILDGVYIGVTHTRDMRNAMLQSLVIFMLGSIVLILGYGNHGLWASYYLLMITRGLTLTRTLPRIQAAFSTTSHEQYTAHSN